MFSLKLLVCFHSWKNCYQITSMVNENEKLGFFRFWGIKNRILNRIIPSMPTIINIPGVILFLSDKAKHFAIKFTSHTSLSDQGSQSASFVILVSWLGKFPDSLKFLTLWRPLVRIKSPVVLLKSLSSELFPVLAKLFNRCLKEKCSSSQWKLSTMFSRILVNAHSRCIVTPSASFESLENSDSITNKYVIDHIVRNNLLCDKQYEFRSPMSTAELMTVFK